MLTRKELDAENKKLSKTLNRRNKQIERFKILIRKLRRPTNKR